MSKAEDVAARLEELAAAGLCCLHEAGTCAQGTACRAPAPQLEVFSPSVHLATCARRSVTIRGCACLFHLLPTRDAGEGGMLAEVVLAGAQMAAPSARAWWQTRRSHKRRAHKQLVEQSWLTWVAAMCLPGGAYREAVRPLVEAWESVEEAGRLSYAAGWLRLERLGVRERRVMRRVAGGTREWLWLDGGRRSSPLSDEPLTAAWLCYGGPTLGVAGREILTLELPSPLVSAALARCMEERAYGSSGSVYVHRGPDPSSLGSGRLLTRHDVVEAGELGASVEAGLGLWAAACEAGEALSVAGALALGEAATRA